MAHERENGPHRQEDPQQAGWPARRRMTLFLGIVVAVSLTFAVLWTGVLAVDLHVLADARQVTLAEEADWIEPRVLAFTDPAELAETRQRVAAGGSTALEEDLAAIDFSREFAVYISDGWRPAAREGGQRQHHVRSAHWTGNRVFVVVEPSQVMTPAGAVPPYTYSLVALERQLLNRSGEMIVIVKTGTWFELGRTTLSAE